MEWWQHAFAQPPGIVQAPVPAQSGSTNAAATKISAVAALQRLRTDDLRGWSIIERHD